MSNNRCVNCGFLNFATDTFCKRCRTSFSEVAAFETSHQTEDNHASRRGPYEIATQWPPPAYQSAYYPTAVAALPARSISGGANVFLWVLLGGAIAVASAIGFLWKFNKPVSDNYTWQEVQAPDNSFTITMPVKPVETTDDLKPDVKLHSLTANMKKDGFYGVAYADYQINSTEVPVEYMLDAAANGSAINSGAEIRSKKSITINGYPGLETDMEVPSSRIPGGGRVACRLFWVTPRMYIVCVGGPESSPVYASTIKYLDSFRLKK